MSNFVKSANLFPYMDLWRIGGDPDINHFCGGLTSIVVFLLIMIIVIVKMVEVFQMITVFATETVINDLIPSTMIITTSQNNPDLNPFMFAFSLQNSYSITATPFNISDIEASVNHYKQQNNGDSNLSITVSPVILEPCTIQHFSIVPNVETKFTSWGFDKFTCLGLNQTFEIGGAVGFRSVYQALKIDFRCKTSNCNSSTNNNLIFTTVSLDTFINPTNASFPELSYSTPYPIAFQSNSYLQYTIALDSSQVKTDQSILPFEKINSHLSYKSQGTLKSLSVLNSEPLTTVWISKSIVRTHYERVFLKLLDAVAYAGGIFQSLLGIFFFMGGFGRLIYELEFASIFFKDKEVKETGFLSYIKHSIYGVLQSLSFKPDWGGVEKQVQYQKTVNNLLDIVYLQKRIEFLEKTMGVLFEKHQLKGLYLINSLSKQEIDENYNNHKLRNRFLCYLLKHKKRKSQNNHQIRQEFRERKIISGKEKTNNLPTKSGESEVELRRGQFQNKILELSEECQMDEEGEGEINEQLLVYQITKEMRKLVEEGDKPNGDIRSKNIKKMIGAQIWRRLKETIKEGQEKGLYYVIPPLEMNNE